MKLTLSCVIVTFCLMLAASGCDKFAQIEVNNHTGSTLIVRVNDRGSIEVPADSRRYVGPGVNERLKSLQLQLLADGTQDTEIRFDTFDDDLVVHVLGPPLRVEVTHHRHPSPTWTMEAQ